MHRTISGLMTAFCLVILVSNASATTPIELSTDHACFAITDMDVIDLSIGDVSFFGMVNSAFQTSLYVTDGTAFNTTEVKDINPSGDDDIGSGIVFNGHLLFPADDGTNGIELWVSDGTEGGTSLVLDINSSEDSNPTGFVEYDGMVYFTADDGTNGEELWVTDGTSFGTHMLLDIEPGSGSSSPSDFAEMNGELFFSAYESTTGRELWKTDGTSEGTCIVVDLESGTSSANPENIDVIGSTLIFYANGQMAISDGTASGTEYLFTSGNDPCYADGNSYAIFDGYYYYDGLDESSNPQLWRTDGTPAGSEQIAEINQHSIDFFCVADDYMVLQTTDDTDGCVLYTSDGTTEGTSFLVDTNPSGDTMFGHMVAINNVVYFTSLISLGSDAYLYRTDGTSSGTWVYADPDDAGEVYATLALCGDVLLMSRASGTPPFMTMSSYIVAPTPKKETTRDRWHMVGVPVEVTASQTGDYFFQDDFGGSAPNGSNWCMSRWCPELDCYVRLCETDSDGSENGDPCAVEPGIGYWVIQDVDDNASLTLDDDQVVEIPREDMPIIVDLNNPSADPAYRGLTMLANPLPVKYEVAHSYLAPEESEPASILMLVAYEFCSANVYTWDPDAGASGQYVTTSCETAILDPWEGFWFELYEDLGVPMYFVFMPDELYNSYSGGDVADYEPDRQVTDTAGWTLDMPVRSIDGGYLDEYNRIGIDERSRDGFDVYDGSEFNPMGGRSVQAYFSHPEWGRLNENYTFDLRNTDFSHGPKEWEYTVRTWRLGNREFEIEWPGIADIPPEYRFTMIENSTGDPAELDMRDQTSIRFRTGPHTGDYEVHTWTIRVEKAVFTDNPEICLLPSSYDFQSPYPNPFNPTSMLTIALPQASNLKVQVFNTLGQQVATLANGKYNAGYQKLVLNGGNLASGTYLVRAQVPGELDRTQKIQLVK